MKIIREKDGSYTFDGEGNTIVFAKNGEYGCKFEGFENDKVNICNWIILGESKKTRKIWNIFHEKTLKDKIKRFFRKLFINNFYYKKFNSNSLDELIPNKAYSFNDLINRL